jgi:hypothetical protein
MIGFEIRDAEVDIATLAQRITQDIAARRARAAEVGLDFEAIAGPASASSLDEALTLIRLSYASISLDPEPLGPAAIPWRHPLRWFKRQAHALVVYYVNRLGYRQMVFNSGTLQLLEQLLVEGKAEVTHLRTQVADLTERLVALEQQGK